MFSPLGVGRCRLGLRPGLVCEVSDLEVKGMSDQFIFLIFKKIIIFLEVVEWTLVVVFSVSPFFKKNIHTYTYTYISTRLLWHFVPFIHISLSLSLFFCLSMPICFACLFFSFFFVYGICGRLNRNMKRCSRPARRCNTIYGKK